MTGKLLRGALGVLLSGHLAAFLYIASGRLAYPFDVEWMEGGELMAAVRIQEGKPVYPPPGADHVPFFYPPLYPALVALVARTGVSLAAGRGVSLACALLAMALLGWIVWRETGKPRAAAAGVGLVAALAQVGGGFLDLARPDSLALLLCLSGAALLRFGGERSAALAGATLALACFAKQPSITAALGAGAWLLWRRDLRRLGLLVASFGGVAAAGFLLLEHATAGGFSFYTLRGHPTHAFYRHNLVLMFWRDALFLAPLLLLAPLAWLRARFPSQPLVWLGVVHLAVAFAQRAATLSFPEHMYYRDLWYEHPRGLLLIPPLLVGALCALRAAEPPGEPRPDRSFWLAQLAAALLASALGHSTQWAYKNALLPLVLHGSLFAALALHDLASGRRRWALPVALAVQLVALWEPPSRRRPSAGDHAALGALERRLAQIEGPVMVLAHPLLSFQRDRTEHLHHMGLYDLAASGGIPDLEPRLARHEWAAIVTDEGDGLELPPILSRYYRAHERLEGPPMRTGTLCRPAVLWLPRP